MNNPEFRPHTPADELRLLEYLDGGGSEAERAATAARLRACAECQTLRQQWERLDAQLESGVRRPQLSTDFARRLRERIERETPSPAAAPSPERRRQVAAELDARWADFRKRFLWDNLPSLLDGLGYGLMAAVVGWLLWQGANSLVNASGSLGSASTTSWLLSVAIGAGVVVVLAAVGFAARRQVAGLLQQL